jgi:hypothetical protein
MGISHLAIGRQSDVMVIGGTNHDKGVALSGLLVKRQNQSLQAIEVPTNSYFKIKGEILNVTLSQDQHWAVSTSHEDNTVVLWNLQKNCYQDALKIQKPKGVLFSKDTKFRHDLFLLHEQGLSRLHVQYETGKLEQQELLLPFDKYETPDSHVFFS